MPRVDFYHDADSKISVTVRLAQKAYTAGKKLVILVPDAETATQIDRRLWTSSPLAFIPHCTDHSPLSGESPIVIYRTIGSQINTQDTILINLEKEVPDSASRFERVIEIVTSDDNDKVTARERYRHYRSLGCQILAHRLDGHE